MNTAITALVAAEHRRELLAEAEAYRLARAATALRRMARRAQRAALVHWFARLTPARVEHS